jgi:AcrR family transcriptional regulator
VIESDPVMQTKSDSPRRRELLEAAYRYVLAHGLADLSLRPLAKAIGSSPRVLLFLFGSKDGLVRALLARARDDELAALDVLGRRYEGSTPGTLAREIWTWLVDPAHRSLLVLWIEGYSRSLNGEPGPWAGFARDAVSDWLALLRRSGDGEGSVSQTLTLAVLRGALIDLLATGDVDRTSAAVNRYFDRF